MKNISKAIISVMSDVKGIEKSMTVGSGVNSYKGVPDQEVKKIIGESMAKNGLCILPIDIDAKVELSRWDEESVYNGKASIKQKQSVFTQVKTKYLLLHESGESIEISGYGHGVDSQDKGAGKATTYALKYALLYSFMIPTGKIDDADSIHSEDIVKDVKPVQAYDLQTAIYDIGLANTLEGLKHIWSKYPKFQHEPTFIEAKDKKKGELNG